jgi:TonB family protein
MRVIPILVEPLEQGASSPRDSSPSHSANAIRDVSMDIAVDGTRPTNEPNDATRDANSPGVNTSGPSALGEGAGFGTDADAMASGGASGAGGSGGITGVSGADGVVAFGQTQRIFAQWLDSAIRARLSYPERARARNAEGTVVVALTVPADGARCDALVAKSSGNSILDRAAIELIRSLFPAKVAPGTPFSAPVTISFTLTSASNP